jgi:hypothetical protein
MKRVAVVLICVAGLLGSLPCFATEVTPLAGSNAVSPTLPLAAPASAPLPSWLAPQSAQPAAGEHCSQTFCRFKSDCAPPVCIGGATCVSGRCQLL